MRKSTLRWLAIVLASVVYLGMAACSGETQADAEGAGVSGAASEAAGEHAAAESGGVEGAEVEAGGEHARSEGGDEHGEGGEGGEHARSEGGGEHGEGGEGGEHARSEGGGEHGEGGEGGGHDEEGDESGEYIGMEDTWDATRRGARLVLSFDSASGAFVGTVENTTRETICAVRVEVHLSTGTELGPTERTDLPPGQTTAVTLPTAGESFDTWTAHPEISPCLSPTPPSSRSQDRRE